MIAVIADDFTGAAELAGIALRYGLTVELFVDSITVCNADVLVVSTDSRSLKKARALAVTVQTMQQVLGLQPEWIYKKTDSVLRGYVVDELKVQLQLMGMQKAFLQPANPSLGRTIVNGEYFIAGKRISETPFKDDPEFPVTSSFIKEILKNEAVVVNAQDTMPAEGIVVGEAATAAAVAAWAASLDNTWLFAGAGDFFMALLERKYKHVKYAGVTMLSPHLYVCGTAFSERKQFIETLDCCLYMPAANEALWLQQAASIIREQKKLVIAIEESRQTALELRTAMARLVNEIAVRENVKEIFIEGGSTAAAVLEEMNIKKLTPVNELSRGVVRMKTDDLFITVKPGSYQLPEEIKTLYVSHG